MRLEKELAKLAPKSAERSAVEQPAMACADCGTAISDTYYSMGEKIICSMCRTGAQLSTDTRSGGVLFLRALFLGIPAAALGAAIYYTVGALTGYEFGLVAIVIGLMVGHAVRYGSGGRGGWAYQTLAVALTYCSIASTYMPGVMEGIREQGAEEELTAGGAGLADAERDFAAADVAVTAPDPTGSHVEEASTSEVAIAFVFLFAISLAVPFLAGLENIVGLFIIAIGLYEAWKLNKRVDFEITGPHKVETPSI